MILMKDHEDSDGDFDWVSFRRARIAAGELCCKCHAFIPRAKGGPAECSECKGLRSTGEARHSHRVRCPSCGESWDPEDLYEEGGHDASCNHCDHDFRVAVEVSYTITSPARLDEVKQ